MYVCRKPACKRRAARYQRAGSNGVTDGYECPSIQPKGSHWAGKSRINHPRQLAEDEWSLLPIVGESKVIHHVASFQSGGGQHVPMGYHLNVVSVGRDWEPRKLRTGASKLQASLDLRYCTSLTSG